MSSRLTWVLAVASPMYMAAAISRLLRPWASSSSASRSRSVRSSGSAADDRSGLGLPGELLDQSSGDRRRKERVALCDDADGGDEVFRRRVLQEVPAGAGAHRGVHVLVEVERGEHEHLGVAVVARGDETRGFDAVHDGHPDVHQHDVGTGPLAQLHPEATVLGVTDDVDVGLGIEDHA